MAAPAARAGSGVNGVTGDGSPWSLRQRYLLQALGHVVPRLAGDEDLAPVADTSPAPAAPATRAATTPGRDDAPVAPVAPRRRAPVEPAPPQSPAAPEPVARHGAMRRPAALPDRLQLAVLRASGLAPSDPRLQALLAEWPSSRLHGNADAKRALWPLLRALRRPE